jgi:carbonic anhydrase
MMSGIQDLLDANKQWAKSVSDNDPDFFPALAQQQKPEYLWIGCSDSRVPANQITGLLPGEVFVHRNIANLVKYTDFNCQSVVQYAVDVLKVKHIIVCGHYGCGGVKAATTSDNNGMVDEWIRSIKDMYARDREKIEQVKDETERFRLLCELNAKEQVANLSRTKTIQAAWGRGQDLEVHGWIYDIKDGLLKDLQVSISAKEQLEEIYQMDV